MREALSIPPVRLIQIGVTESRETVIVLPLFGVVGLIDTVNVTRKELAPLLIRVLSIVYVPGVRLFSPVFAGGPDGPLQDDG